MNEERLYRVLIEMDVTAKDEDEALVLAVEDILELQSEGDLDAEVTDLSGDAEKAMKTRNFASVARMVEIANAAIDSFGEMLNGRSLYDCLAGSLKMDDEEILAAGFTTLKEFMGREGDCDEK